MQYQVHCECKKSIAVSGADAGAAVRCPCGKTVEVPPLHVLRTSAGQAVLSPAVRIQSMLLAGSLPNTRACAWCQRETGDQVQVAVDCERVIHESKMGGAETLAGCFLFGAIPALMLRSAAKTVEHGEHVAFSLPLPVCDACRTRASNPGELRTALRHVPEYAELLDAYPRARVVLVG